MDQQLKQRLVGATVLVSLAVIFIPVILDGPRDDWTPRSSTMPDAPDIDFRSATELPLPAAGPPPETRNSAPTAIPTPAVARPKQPPETRVATAAAPAAPASKPVQAADTPTASGTTAARGWYVQVGSFSQEANASGLRDGLQDDGFSALLLPGGTSGKRSYRVLVGPVSDRAAAAALQTRLQAKRKLEGLVIELGGG